MATSLLFPDLKTNAEQTSPTETMLSPAMPPELPVSIESSGSNPSASATLPDLFGEPSVSSKTAAGESEMVNAVVSKQDSKEKILGPKPKTNTAGIPLEGKSFNLGGFLVKLSLLIGIFTFVFFYSQLTPGFNLFGVLGKNPVTRLADLTTSVQEEQTTINLYTLLVAKFSLDDFIVTADTYLYKASEYNSEYTSSNTKAELAVELAALKTQIQTSLSTVKTNLLKPVYPKALALSAGDLLGLEDLYSTLLQERIINEEESLFATGAADETLSIELDNLEGASLLFSNKDLKQKLKALDLETELTDDVIQSLFSMATQVSTNEFAIILNIKSARVNWTELLTEVTSVTKEVDPLYATALESNITYSGISFDAADQTLSLRGTTLTDDTKNFSLISDLVDEFEKSPLFANASNRSFSKSGEEDEGYNASFSIEVELQQGSDDRDDPAHLVTVTEEEERISTETPVTDTTTDTAPTDATAEPSIDPTTDTLTPDAEIDSGATPSAEKPAAEETSFLSGLSANFLKAWDGLINRFFGEEAPQARVPRHS
ncbi:MAG: hypothetical protein WC882_00210 [Candidatus Gracilibacteria bacterium]